ncbi:MAG: hypothetical protein PHS96_13580 [Anaerolineales bacterium]|nr:hypothetical protein [Anaerolineales bacterium]
MKNATRVFASTFGAVMALAGIEHGIGEILQGNVAPSGIMILSWPESEFFRSLSGEPAMTVIPNLFITGILAVFVSLALLVWAALFVQRKNGGLIMMLLSIAMLLVGGGIFPPIFGILIGAVATRIHAPGSSSKAYRSDGFRRFLAKLWPWSYAACIIAWLCLLPGVPLLDYFSSGDNTAVILAILFFVLGTLVLTMVSGFARDLQMHTGPGSSHQDMDHLRGQSSAKKPSIRPLA